MCQVEKVALQRGMNFRLNDKLSVILMSLRKGAPYADHIENDGKILIYEGHDISKKGGGPNPKNVDQPTLNTTGTLTQNGLFFEAAKKYKKDLSKPELVRVYEKIKTGIWTYNGIFNLIDAWQEISNSRKVFKFKLELTSKGSFKSLKDKILHDIEHSRIIPTTVKLVVWKRDKGCCIKCGSPNNIHFDHIIPYSKGGSSLVSENIQLLCARHNLAKKDNLE